MKKKIIIFMENNSLHNDTSDFCNFGMSYLKSIYTKKFLLPNKFNFINNKAYIVKTNCVIKNLKNFIFLFVPSWIQAEDTFKNISSSVWVNWVIHCKMYSLIDDIKVQYEVNYFSICGIIRQLNNYIGENNKTFFVIDFNSVIIFLMEKYCNRLYWVDILITPMEK